MAAILKNGPYMALPSAIKRGSSAALDTTAVWYDEALMREYAAGQGDLGAVAYVGQILTLVNETNATSTAYIILNEAGDLQEVGSATLGDNLSIELDEHGTLALKDYGKRYYQYVEKVEATDEAEAVPAHYDLVEVDETHPWKSGLEPRVVKEGDDLVIGWYEPNPTTVDGVQDQVTAVQGDVEQAKKDIDAIEEDIVVVEEKVETINKDLYGYTAEGGEVVDGLIDRTEALEGQVSDLEEAMGNVYTKTEVDGLVSGVFHFEGTAESVEALPAEGNTKGDVYQVGEKEYAWNGTVWVELGFVVDLSAYATTAYVDGEIDKVEEALNDYAKTTYVDGEIDKIEEALQSYATTTYVDGEIDKVEEALKSYATTEFVNGEIDTVEGTITTLDGKVDGAIERIAANELAIGALQTADEGFTSQFEAVNGEIDNLKKADVSFETRVGDLEAKVGSPSTLETALFPAVEALQERIEGIVSQGGEANLINGLTINGTKLTPNAEKIIDLPIFNGTNVGFVPVVGDNILAPATSFLSAEGAWIDVAAMIDDKMSEVMTWEEISAE